MAALRTELRRLVAADSFVWRVLFSIRHKAKGALTGRQSQEKEEEDEERQQRQKLNPRRLVIGNVNKSVSSSAAVHFNFQLLAPLDLMTARL